MPADTVTAKEDPELRPHPRVTPHQHEQMTAGVAAFFEAHRRLREPVTSTHTAFEVSVRLARFAHALGGAIAAPADTTTQRERAKWVIAMSSAVTSLEFCAELVPNQPLDTTRCEPAREELLDWGADVEMYSHRHPYRRFLSWWMVAVSAATKYATAAHEVAQHTANERACFALRMANVNAPLPVADLSDGYLETDDLAALCFTTAETVIQWWQDSLPGRKFAHDPFPLADIFTSEGVNLWHAERAREVRAWWLRHDELPVAEHPTRTPGHRIGDRWLVPAP